ncbi:MAG: 5'-3' exonuclease, partial [Burkholderiaceae bacterium]
MSEPTLLLVDGSSYLYRAFHAMPDLRTRAGEPTGAIRGVVSMLRRLRADRKLAGDVRYGAVVFDAPGRTFRDDLYEQYKANRAETPADLRAQIAPIHEMVRAMGWPLLHVAGIEADDVIGTLTEQAWRMGLRTVVSTGDKDLAQLVNPHVTLVDTMTRNGEAPQPMDRDGVIAKFGVPPERIVDWLTLVGDAVDNVPGVPKVGPKTAVKWLAEHGSLDGVIAAADRIGGVVGENLRTALGWLPTARALVTIKTDCDLSAHLSSIDQGLVLNPEDGDTLRALFERYEMKSMIDELRERGAPVPARGPRAAAGPATGAVGTDGGDAAVVGDDTEAGASPVAADDPPAHPVEYECVLDDTAL